MESGQQTRKRSKISKNRKKGWKKTDIKDVEDFLEDERLQERTGGLVAEKKDEQLFIVDKAPEEEPQIKRKRKKDTKNLKCHSNLYLDPRIKPARVAHNIRKQTLDKRHKRVVEKILSGKKTKTELQAAIQSQKDIQQKKVTKRSEHRLFSKPYDLWGKEEEKPSEEEVPNKKQEVKPSRHFMVKPTDISNVEVPHPGSSYNPAFDDYQDLLQKAHNVEVKKVRIEKKIYNALDAKFKDLDAATLEKTWLTEMSAGLDDAEMVDDNDVGDLDKISVNPPVQREKKKTKTQRNKEKKLKELEKLQQKDREKKLRDNAIFRLRSMKADIHKDAEEARKRKELREKRIAENKKKTRKLGKLKFEEPNLEIKLPDELESSLRLLKPEGHLFEDRFKSLQKRSIIEPRAQTRNKRKYRPKVYVKRSHRPEEYERVDKRLKK